MSNVLIRSFQHSDTDVLREILVDSFDGVSIDQNIELTFGSVGSHDWKWRKGKHLDDDLRRDSSGCFVAIIGDEIAGFVSTWKDSVSSIGFIPNLAVHKNHRGKGIGRKLLEHALAHFRQAGLSVARIETLAQNPVGQHLYPSVGFKEVARQIHFAARLD